MAGTPPAQPSISTRTYIKWSDRPATEPTSTLVLTSPSGRFVDIRVLKSHLSPNYSVSECQESPSATLHLPILALDWAFAGVATSTPIADTAPSDQASAAMQVRKHCTWSHEIDSWTPLDGHPARDEGIVVPHPNDATLEVETGRMANPDSGVEEAYEEGWKVLPVQQCGTSDSEQCLVLRMEGDEGVERGLWIKVGRRAQGVCRRRVQGSATGEEEFWATRWAWREGTGWWCEFVAGPGDDEGERLPPMLFTWMLEPWEREPTPRAGDSVTFADGERWLCL